MAIEPVTREERFLAAAGGRSVTPPDPITRKEQLLQGIIDAVKSGGATPDVIKGAVNDYMNANPVQPGATTEQAAQIEQNKNDIADLQTDVDELKESGGNGSGQNPDEIRAAVFEYMEQDATGAVVAVDAQEPTTEDNTTYIVMQSRNGTIFRLAIGDDGLPFVTNEAGATVWSGASGGSGGGDTGGGEDSGGDDSTEIPENVEGVYTNNVITEVPAKAFQNNSKLTGVNLPNVTTVGEYAFCNCDGLTKLVLPKCASVGIQGIALCDNLRVIDLGGVPVGGLGYQSLTNSKNLETLILRCDSTVWGCAAMSIGGTKLEEDTGYVYVPTKMMDAYTAHDIWKGYSIRALEDYTVDGSSTGELDATKTGGAV